MSNDIRYIGQYQDGYIYGTLDNYKVLVEIPPNSTIKTALVRLTVVYNSKTWTHSFQIPFYQLNVVFPIANYVHSIMSNDWELPTFSTTSATLNSFDMAQVKVEVSDPDSTGDALVQQVDFYMITGSITPIPLSNLTYGGKVLLNSPQTEFVHDQAVIAYTFLSNTLPNTINVTNGSSAANIALLSGSTNKYLHTITIPVKLLLSPMRGPYQLRLIFENNRSIDAGAVNLLYNHVDHYLIAYQNKHNTLSVMELSGAAEFTEQIRSASDTYTDYNIDSILETEFSESLIFEFSTGYIYDQYKHAMIKELMKSYSKHLLLNGKFEKVVNQGNTKINPYTTNNRLLAENLKFKKATNDDFSNRII